MNKQAFSHADWRINLRLSSILHSGGDCLTMGILLHNQFADPVYGSLATDYSILNVDGLSFWLNICLGGSFVVYETTGSEMMTPPPLSNVGHSCDSCQMSTSSIPTVIDVAIQFVNQTLSVSRRTDRDSFPYYCYSNVNLNVNLDDGFKIDLITMRNDEAQLAIDFFQIHKLEPQTATEPATIPFDPYLQSAGNLSEIVYLPDLSFDASEISAGTHNYQVIGTTTIDGSNFKMATAMDTEGSLLSMANVPNMATSMRIEVTFQLDSASLYNMSSHLKLCILLFEESLLPVNIFQVTDNSSYSDGFHGLATLLMFTPYNLIGNFLFTGDLISTFNTSYSVMGCDIANAYDPTWFDEPSILTIQIYEDLMTVAMTTSQGPQFFTLAM